MSAAMNASRVRRSKPSQLRGVRARRLACEALERRDLLSVLSSEIELIGHAIWGGPGGNGSSGPPSISADGRYVAFDSGATNFEPLLPVPVDLNGAADIFLHDRGTGLTRRITHGYDGSESNGMSLYPAINADGRFIAFESDATNLVPDDTNGVRDIFVYDAQTGAIERASLASSGAQAGADCRSAAISGDGRYVAFHSSADNLVPGDVNGIATDVFVYDRQTGTIECASRSRYGTTGNSWSEDASLSGDGRYVAFSSRSSDLTSDDTNWRGDIFVYDRVLGRTEIVSRSNSGALGNDQSLYPDISADGRYVAFRSLSTNLVPGDTNNWYDVFVYDRQLDTIERVSLASDGTQGLRPERGELPPFPHPAISGDGRRVAFSSWVTNFVPGDTNGLPDIFVYDRQTDTIERASTAVDGTEANGEARGPSISDDGRSVAFCSTATHLVPGFFNSGAFNVFVKGPTYLQDLGTVAFVQRAGVDPNGGTLEYRLTTVRAGLLSIDATYDSQGGTASIALLDASRTVQTTSAVGAGYERVDWTAGAGEVYYLRLSGTNHDIDLRAANLVNPSGNRVTVTGTGQDDVFDFDAASRALTIDGIRYRFTDAAITAFSFSGGSGDDLATLRARGDKTDTVRLWKGRGTLTSAADPLTVAVNGVERITAVGGSTSDRANFYDSTGADTFYAYPTYAYLTGPDFYNYARGFGKVCAYATAANVAGATDRATLFDSTGSDTFYAYPTYAYLTGAGFYNYAKGFDKVYAYATAANVSGAIDRANLYDSTGSDRFYAYPAYAYLYGTGFYNYARGFDKVYAYATAANTAGAIDRAFLYDSSGNDKFYGRTVYGYLFGSGFYNYATGFNQVTADGTKGGANRLDIAALDYLFQHPGAWI